LLLEDTEMLPENNHFQGAGLVSQKENLLRMGLRMRFVTAPEEGHLRLIISVLGYRWLLIVFNGVTAAISDCSLELH